MLTYYSLFYEILGFTLDDISFYNVVQSRESKNHILQFVFSIKKKKSSSLFVCLFYMGEA